jgi:hypothetical protein
MLLQPTVTTDPHFRLCHQELTMQRASIAIECVPSMAIVLAHCRRMTKLLPVVQGVDAAAADPAQAHQYSTHQYSRRRLQGIDASPPPPPRPVLEHLTSTPLLLTPPPRPVPEALAANTSARICLPTSRHAEVPPPRPVAKALSDMVSPAQSSAHTMQKSFVQHSSPPPRPVVESPPLLDAAPPVRPIPESKPSPTANPSPPDRPVQASPLLDDVPPMRPIPESKLLVHSSAAVTRDDQCRCMARWGSALRQCPCWARHQNTTPTSQYLSNLRGKFGILDGARESHKRGFTGCCRSQPLNAMLRARLDSSVGTALPSCHSSWSTHGTLTLDEIDNAANELAGRLAAAEAACLQCEEMP